MPLYQVKAVVSSRVKTGTSVVSVDEMMLRSERPERTWAAVKTLQPPSGNSTVRAAKVLLYEGIFYQVVAEESAERPLAAIGRW